MPLPSSDQEMVILHNPRCSKSLATLSILEDAGLPFTVRRYLDDPLDEDELREVGRRLGRPASEWVRSGEAAYEQAGLSADADDALHFAAMAKYPALMERPIVVRGERAVIGRPPQDVRALLQS